MGRRDLAAGGQAMTKLNAVVFTVATLGIAWLLAFITRWIITAILLVITDKITDHLKIDSFGWALGGALVMSLVGTAGEWVVRSMF